MELGKHILRKEEEFYKDALITSIWLHPDHPMSKKKDMQNILLTVKTVDRTVTQRVYIPKDALQLPETVISTVYEQTQKAELL